MAINIMDQLDKDFSLKSGNGGSIVNKLNMAIENAGGEAHVGTIQDRVKELNALKNKIVTILYENGFLGGFDDTKDVGYVEPNLPPLQTKAVPGQEIVLPSVESGDIHMFTPSDPRETYSFEGWSTSKTSGTPEFKTTYIAPGSDITLYAVFNKSIVG